MILDSSSRKAESAGMHETQPEVVNGCSTSSKRLEWSSSRVLTGTSSSVHDAKSLAARRKRAEIRRLRLMAAALDDDDDDDEPFGKRSKASWSTPDSELNTTAKTYRFPEVKVRGCASVSGGEKHKMQASAVPTNLTSGGNDCMPSLTPCMRQGLRTVNGGDEGGSAVESRLTMSQSSEACPSHCVVSICGRSREMEDAAIAVPAFVSMPSSSKRHADTFHFYGVYDGHGGPQAAEYCKERMHGVMADEMSAAGDGLFGQWEACFQSCFGKLDAALCGLCPHGSVCPHKLIVSSTSTSSSCREPLVPGSVGTTAVVAVVGPDHIVVGNCGDSRAILSRRGQVVALSHDHKANRPDEVARIEAAGGHVFTWQGHRVCGVLAMSRALGDGFLKPFVSGQPEVTITARSDDDECLILASDGLWDALSNEFVCGVARKALANWRRQHRDLKQKIVLEFQNSLPHASVDVEDSPAQVVAALLTKLALAKHSKDNISVIVVDLKRL